MTTTPSSCRIDESANEAARIMWERDCSAVPVVDYDGRATGIVTDRDICMAAYFNGFSWHTVASDGVSAHHATRSAPCCLPSTSSRGSWAQFPSASMSSPSPRCSASVSSRFKYDHKLLGELSRCFYESIREIFLDAAPQAGCSPTDSPALPAMVASIQTYGDHPARFHPHLHCLVADGLALPDGSFLPIAQPDPVQIMLLFRHKLLKTLLAKEKITQRLVDILLSWRHPGFSVFQGDSVSPEDHEARERLARYCVHPPMALDRLRYDPQNHQVTYQPKNHGRSVGPDSPTATTGSALDFLAALCTHIPDAGHQLVRYYGQWSHVRRARARQAARHLPHRLRPPILRMTARAAGGAPGRGLSRRSTKPTL